MKRILFLWGLLILPLSFAAAQDKEPKLAEGLIEVHDLFNTSMNLGVSCYRIPALVTASNGDLVVAIDERVPSCQDLRGSDDINIVIRRSQDNGKSWSEIRKIVDFPMGKSASDPSMIVDQVTGEIFLFYNFMDLEKEKDIYYLHVIKSADHGKSWETRPEPELIDPGCNGSIIRYTSIKDGYELNRLLFCNAKHKKGRENLSVRISYDEGLTWTEGKCIYPGSAAYSTLTVLENGVIGLLFEKDYYTENMFVSFSLEWLTDGEDRYHLPLAK